MELLQDQVLSSLDSQPRTTMMLAEVLLLDVVTVSAVTEVLVNNVVEQAEVADKERSRSTTINSQLSEPGSPASAAPWKVSVKYPCHAHAFQCGAE